MPFNEVTNTTDPRWNDLLLFNKECKEYIQLVKSYFLKNEKGLSPTEIVSSFNSLLNDDGSTICKTLIPRPFR
mgnify:FL=1